MSVRKILCSVLIGYLFGCLNWADIFAKLKGMDIHKEGTGNAGATNVMFTMGLKKGLIVMVLDILKAILAIILVGLIWPDPYYLRVLAGVFCVVGHMFPFYMHFRGGKGTACFGGLVIALTPQLALPLLMFAVAVAFISNIACLVPIVGVTVYPLLFHRIVKKEAATLILCVLCPLILYGHRKNFERIRNGEESHFRDVILGKIHNPDNRHE